MIPILAQGFATGNIVHWVILFIVVAAVIAIAMVGIQKMGLVIPDWVARIFWIVVVACVCILAIKIVISAM